MIQYANNETTGKLILLYVLDRMECEVTEDTIIDMCYYQKKWISYFTCKIALSELTKSGFVQESRNTEKTKYYTITPEGRSCLSFFYNDIPNSTRNDIAEFVKENKLSFKRKQEYFYDSFKNSDGTYSVVLKIVEPTTTALEIKFNAPDSESAKTIEQNWLTSASLVYSDIFNTLLNNTEGGH